MKKIFFLLVIVSNLGFRGVWAAETSPELKTTTETTTEVATPSSSLDKAETKLREILSPIYVSLEVFRKKEAEHFAIVRDKAKAKLGINLAEDAIERIKPFLAPPAAPSAIPGTNTGEELEIKKIDNPKDYVILIFSTALASLFASAWMFYTAIVLIFFFLIRLIFRMIV